MWQPIETAPIDGTEFLGYDPVARKYDVVYGEPLKVPPHSSDRMFWSTQSDGEYGPGDDDFQVDRMTLWMTIPTPHEASDTSP